MLHPRKRLHLHWSRKYNNAGFKNECVCVKKCLGSSGEKHTGCGNEYMLKDERVTVNIK